MDDWPRLDAVHATAGNLLVEMYRRDDDAGRGRCVSLHVEGAEVMRFDLFPAGAHEHWAVDSAPRRFYPYAWGFRRNVDLAMSNLVEHARAAMDAAGLDGIELVVDDLHQLMRWAKARLLHPPTRVVIPCAGQGDRWHDYLGRRKHFVNIDGETLIGRLARQLRGHAFGDVVALMPPGLGCDGVQCLAHEPRAEMRDADKYLSAVELALLAGRTVVLFGDVWFSDETIARVAHDVDGGWKLIARPSENHKVGKPWPEAFGISFWHYHIPAIRAAADRVLDLQARDVTDGSSLWHLYRALLGFPDDWMGRNLAGEHLLLVNDWTHDFDLPDDYERFMEARR